MYHIIAVDLSVAKLAVTVTDEDGYVKEVANYMLTENTQQRYLDAFRVGRRLSVHYKKLGRVYAFPEKPISWRSSRATLALAGIASCLTAGFLSGGADVVIEANNQTWKRDVVGRGDASKPQIADYIHKHWPSMYEYILTNFKATKGRPDQDLLDSACINIYGQQIMARKLRLEGDQFVRRLRRKKERV